jgi:hypothetical protein
MKFIVDWIEDILGLFGNTEVYSELPKETKSRSPAKRKRLRLLLLNLLKLL